MPPKRAKSASGLSDILDKDNFYDDPQEELRKKGIYYITGTIEEDSLLHIHQDLILKHQDPKWKDDVQIIINSLGGDVGEGWALVDLINFVKMDVRTIGMGYCQSLGALLLSAGSPGKRIAAKNLAVMIHGMQTATDYGDKSQLVAQVKYVIQEHERDIRFWIEHSKYTTRRQVEKFFLNGHDNHFNADQSLKHGIVDFIQGSNKISEE